MSFLREFFHGTNIKEAISNNTSTSQSYGEYVSSFYTGILDEVSEVKAPSEEKVKKEPEVKVPTVAEIHAAFAEKYNQIEIVDSELVTLEEKCAPYQAKIKSINQLISLRERAGFGKPKSASEELKSLNKEYSELARRKVEVERKKKENDVFIELKNKYPLRTFIWKKDVIEVCKKYNLTLGYTVNYIGEMPEKNLQELLAYKSLEEQCRIVNYVSTSSFELSQGITVLNNDSKAKIVDEREYDTLLARAHHTINNNRNERWRDVGSTRASIISDLGGTNSFGKELKTFIIACPAADLTKTMDHVDIKRSPIYVPDPVVFMPVGLPDIWEVVTKWGDEANDPALSNPNFN